MGMEAKAAVRLQDDLLEKTREVYLQQTSEHSKRLSDLKALAREASRGSVHLLLAKAAYQQAVEGLLDLPHSNTDDISRALKGCSVTVRATHCTERDLALAPDRPLMTPILPRHVT